MHLLEVVASPEQQERYLRPLARRRGALGFAMTEPAPGAGSDPTMLRTTARRDGGGWVIDGRKWLITGRRRARVRDLHGAHGRGDRHDEGATMFLVDSRQPGHARRAADPDDGPRLLGRALPWSIFDDCRVPADAVLGEVGLGYRYAQVRLAPARLTHCMRWLGLARRALDIALDSAADARGVRRAAARAGHGAGARGRHRDRHRGQPRADLRAAPRRSTPAGAERTSRRSPRCSCPRPSGASSTARCRSAAASARATTSRSARYAREVRAFRIYDGPSETHRWSIARRAARRRQRDA